MLATINVEDTNYQIDLNQGIDLSFPLNAGKDNPKCFYAPDPNFQPVRTDTFVGSTQEGSPVNFFNVFFNPHGNGTHTECVGHIAKEKYLINECLKDTFLLVKLIHIKVEKLANGDFRISEAMLKKKVSPNENSALIIVSDIYDHFDGKDFSGLNPPYFEPAAIAYLRDCGIEHLLTDFPSVDREKDDGKLEAHKLFWNYPENIRKNCTITELIFVKKGIKEGIYLLNMQVTNLSLDAAPSRPIIYKLNPI